MDSDSDDHCSDDPAGIQRQVLIERWACFDNCDEAKCDRQLGGQDSVDFLNEAKTVLVISIFEEGFVF